jgi:hypothetical protein
MRITAPERTFVASVKQQLLGLRDPNSVYRGLRLYVAGVAEPWEFSPHDDFEFHDDSGVLIVRDGPTASDGDLTDVPEHVFRLDAVVASQLV